MSTKSYTPRPITASDIPEEWIAKVRDATIRDGQKPAAGPTTDILVFDPQTELQHQLMLPGNGFFFTDKEQRDIVLNRLLP